MVRKENVSLLQLGVDAGGKRVWSVVGALLVHYSQQMRLRGANEGLLND